MALESALTASELLEKCVATDRLLGLSASTLLAMKRERVGRYAEEILGYLAHRECRDPVSRYLARSRRLNQLQERFEQTGRYPASCYAEVSSIDLEEYNLALLLSFVVTVHRFEILESLVEFLRLDSEAPPKLLCVGYGTGYELKLAFDELPKWEIEGYESSEAAAAYAADLLHYFHHPTDGLRHAAFPLEHEDGLDRFEGRYGRIIACELLEHLEQPARALRNLARAMAPGGRMFVTMAIKIAQEDHVYLYRSVDEARQQVHDCGLRVVTERVVPVAVLPFEEDDRDRIFRKGNYVAVVERRHTAPRQIR